MFTQRFKLLIFLLIILIFFLWTVMTFKCSTMYNSKKRVEQKDTVSVYTKKQLHKFASSDKAVFLIFDQIPYEKDILNRKNPLPFALTTKRLFKHAGVHAVEFPVDSTDKEKSFEEILKYHVQNLSKDATINSDTSYPVLIKDVFQSVARACYEVIEIYHDSLNADLYELMLGKMAQKYTELAEVVSDTSCPVIIIEADGEILETTYRQYEIGKFTPSGPSVKTKSVYLSGDIILEMSGQSFYKKSFDYREGAPDSYVGVSYGGLSGSSGSASFFNTLSHPGSFIQKMIEMMSDIYGHDFLINSALEEKDPCIKRYSIEALNQCDSDWRNWESVKQLLPDYLSQLNDSKPKIRKNAIEALGNIKDTIAVNPLIHCMVHDEVEYCREIAAEALGKLKDARAILPLIDFMKNTQENLFVQADIGDALANITGEDFESNYHKWYQWWLHNIDLKDINAMNKIHDILVSGPAVVAETFIQYDGPNVLIDPNLKGGKRMFWRGIRNDLLNYVRKRELENLEIQKLKTLKETENKAIIEINGKYDASTQYRSHVETVDDVDFNLTVYLTNHSGKWYVSNIE